MVGSIVLPVLGAVPDSLMVLFSGISDHPQETLGVGVGALAGSTIMLLTLPWFLSVIGGRVGIDPVSGTAVYARGERCGDNKDSIFSCMSSQGVDNSTLVKKNAVFMMASSLLYLIIQLPSSIFPSRK
jgi:hypothetical protein